MRVALTVLGALALAACDPPRAEVETAMPQPIVIASEGISCGAEESARRIAELEQRNLRLEKLVEALRAR